MSNLHVCCNMGFNHITEISVNKWTYCYFDSWPELTNSQYYKTAN